LEIKAVEKASSSTIHDKEIQSNSPQGLPIVKNLKKEVFELETLNIHLKKEHETLNFQNEIQRTKNDNIMLHLGLWFEKNRKLREINKFLKRKVMSLKCRILMKKPGMTVARKKVKRTNLDVSYQVYEKVQ